MRQSHDSILSRNARKLTLFLAIGATLAGSSAVASNIVVQSTNANSGTHAARLTLSKTCTDGDAIVPDGDYSTSPSLEPCGTLTANDVDVVSGTVHFKAGHSLVIGNGFSVASGASFTAEVGASILGASYLRDTRPSAVGNYSARFYIDPSNLNLTQDSQHFEHLVAYDAQGNREVVLGVTYDTGFNELHLYATAYENNGAMRTSRGGCEQVLPTGWHYVEIHWTASTGSDGDLEVSIDGGAAQSLAACLSLGTGLTNSNGEISAVEWGVQNMPGGNLGSMDLDDFDSRRGGDIGGI